LPKSKKRQYQNFCNRKEKFRKKEEKKRKIRTEVWKYINK